MLWVTNITVALVFKRMSSSKSCISIRVSSSRAPKGSSISSSFGCESARDKARLAAAYRRKAARGRTARSLQDRQGRAALSHAAWQPSWERRSISIGNKTFFRMDRQGIRFACWKTTPKSGCGSATSRPLIWIVPLEAEIRPPTILRNVVLPQPLGPSSVTRWPAFRSNEIFSMATSGACPERLKD